MTKLEHVRTTVPYARRTDDGAVCYWKVRARRWAMARYQEDIHPRDWTVASEEDRKLFDSLPTLLH
jgi:hypothetical protein